MRSGSPSSRSYLAHAGSSPPTNGPGRRRANHAHGLASLFIRSSRGSVWTSIGRADPQCVLQAWASRLGDSLGRSAGSGQRAAPSTASRARLSRPRSLALTRTTERCVRRNRAPHAVQSCSLCCARFRLRRILAFWVPARYHWLQNHYFNHSINTTVSSNSYAHENIALTNNADDSVESAQTPSEHVLQTLANTKEVEVTELDPLYTSINPDSLNSLVSDDGFQQIAFQYEGYLVELDADCDVSINELA